MCHFDNLLILVEKSLELLDADFLSEYLTDLLTAVVTHRVGRTYKFFCNECEKGETDHAYENGTPASNFSYCCHLFVLVFLLFYCFSLYGGVPCFVVVCHCLGRLFCVVHIL